MSTTDEIKYKHQSYVMPTYAPDLVLVRGRGVHVWDSDDNRYLDFVAGIAVTNVGHCHPRLVKALHSQAKTLMHVSNLYYNTQQPELANRLSDLSLRGKCFFCNSGAEANEALIKLARLWGHAEGRYEIITMRNSFHGRTLATLTATGQDKVQKGFEPLPTGFAHAEFNNLASIAEAITDRTVAVLVEPVQGEGGVRPANPAFMKGLRELCDQRKLLLLCDEVQCGVGRTGKWFAYKHYDMIPDAISLAKGFGGGVPVGGIVTTPRLADVFQPGTHATTFGGTPLACAAAREVLAIIEEEDLRGNATRMGELLVDKLKKLAARYDWIREVRGLGLMVGMELTQPAAGLQKILQEKGLLTIATAHNVIRFVPPLTVKGSHIRKAVRIVDRACAAFAAKGQGEET